MQGSESADSQAGSTVARIIDDQSLSRFQLRVMALCFLAVAFDGFDNGAIGYVAPSLVQAWGIARESLGPVLSAALVGLGLGALSAGPLADRFGRKPVIVISVALFGVFTLASVFARSIETLITLRFLTGLGLGAVMPNVTALAADYCPTRRKALLITVTICGFTLGSSLGGFVAAALIPRFGWTSVFWVGGLAPLLLTVVLIAALPESLYYLVGKGRQPERAAAILARIAPGNTATFRAAVPDRIPAAHTFSPVRTILSGHLRTGTLLLWMTYFFGLFFIYLVTSWLPTLLQGAGFNMARSAWITSLFQLGGTAGALLISWTMDKMGAHKMLVIAYLLAGIFVSLAARSTAVIPVFAATVLATGFFMSGAQTPMSALAAGFYPPAVRSTGVSWMLGIGRLGAILGALSGGTLLALDLNFSEIFNLLAIPAVAAAASVGLKGWRYRQAGVPS